MNGRCRRCGDKLAFAEFQNCTNSEFGDMCRLCWIDYFELQQKIDLLKLQFIERRQP